MSVVPVEDSFGGTDGVRFFLFIAFPSLPTQPGLSAHTDKPVY